MENVNGVEYVTNYDLMNQSERNQYNKLTKDQEINSYIKTFNDIKARLNDKQQGSDPVRGYNAFMNVLGIMGDDTKYLNIETLTDAELYHDMSRSAGMNATGCCYGFEAIEWLGGLLSDGAEDLARTRKIVTAIDRLGLILPNDDESAVAVTVKGVDDIHRVTVSDMNTVVNHLIHDLKKCQKSIRFFDFVNHTFYFRGSSL